MAARLVVGADGIRSWMREAAGIVAVAEALWPDRRRGQLRVRARASRRGAAVVSRRWRRAGVAAVAGAAHLDRVVGAGRAGGGTAGARSRRAGGARCRGRRPRAGRPRAADAARRIPALAAQAADHDRASAGARRRCRARRASAGRAGREPGLRRCAGAGGGARRARSGRRCRRARSCWNASRAAGRSRCSRCKPSPTAWPGCSGAIPRGSGRCAMPAWPPSIGCRRSSASWRNLRCARLSKSRPIPWRNHDVRKPLSFRRPRHPVRGTDRGGPGAGGPRRVRPERRQGGPADRRSGRAQEDARAEVPRRRSAQRHQDPVLRPVRGHARRPHRLHRHQGQVPRRGRGLRHRAEGEPHRGAAAQAEPRRRRDAAARPRASRRSRAPASAR